MFPSPLVVCDHRDVAVGPMDFDAVHRNGIPHRAVHIEITNSDRDFLVWRRRDGRLEIPGGHVDWLLDESRPESYEEAATRETVEELNLARNWGIDFHSAACQLRGKLLPVSRLANQIPSSHGYNNEWVTVFSLNWDNAWGDPLGFELSDEGNKEPSWCSLEEIERRCLRNPMGMNSALRLFLQRRSILVPIVAVDRIAEVPPIAATAVKQDDN